MSTEIKQFTGENFFLSNFFPCEVKGRNHLGKILMRVRDEFRLILSTKKSTINV